MEEQKERNAWLKAETAVAFWLNAVKTICLDLGFLTHHDLT